MAYWDHRVKQEFDKSYEFEDPIYRKSHSVVTYIKKFGIDPVRLKEVKVAGLKVEDHDASVDLSMKIEIRAPGARKPLKVETDRNDRWGRIEGVWYHVIGEQSALSGDKK
ncbi:MAG: hypothetical protein HZB33_08245 [Nitrospirae bacterium]|nr:hypothetical protein [Nitrospirota bacterium]